MRELLIKMPEMIGALLEKVAQSKNINDSEEMRAAKEKLISQLRSSMDEMSKLTEQIDINPDIKDLLKRR